MRSGYPWFKWVVGALLGLCFGCSSEAASVSFTVPKWSARDTLRSTPPIVGWPAECARLIMDFRLDSGPWRPWYDLQVSRPGAIDGRRFSWFTIPEGLYRDSLRVRVKTPDAAGLGGWATSLRLKPHAARALRQTVEADPYVDTLRARGALTPAGP